MSHAAAANAASKQAGMPPSLNRAGSNYSRRNLVPGNVPRLQSSETARTDRTDALWAEMQATLEEVELSATGGTHVFGVEHDRKLADLRAAQIALAQAWARSEADDAIETTGSAGAEEVRELKGALGNAGLVTTTPVTATGATVRSGIDTTDQARSTAGTGTARPTSSKRDGERLGATLEEETEIDIILARKRREANDRYFSRVDEGVRDVVTKLENVASAMKAIEQESRDIWGEEIPQEEKA
jgi:hypothetical protein